MRGGRVVRIEDREDREGALDSLEEREATAKNWERFLDRGGLRW